MQPKTKFEAGQPVEILDGLYKGKKGIVEYTDRKGVTVRLFFHQESLLDFIPSRVMMRSLRTGEDNLRGCIEFRSPTVLALWSHTAGA